MFSNLNIGSCKLPPLELATSPQGTVVSTPTEHLTSSSSPYFSQGSPNSLHDVSSGTSVSIPYSTGTRSPGKYSPTGGNRRNLMEYEQELDRLGKENVNLKIRIHLMEEKYGVQSKSAERNALKKTADLKMENEELKKHLKEKQELVTNAANMVLILENQYKEEFDKMKESHEKNAIALLAKISHMEKELEVLRETNHSGADHANYSQFCAMAFDATLGENATNADDSTIKSAFNKVQRSNNGVVSKPQGFFSLPSGEEMNSACGVLANGQNVHDRIKELEEQVVQLETKVVDLKEQLEEKQMISNSLEEDISNLKKEIEEKEEKMCDLEVEVNDKDQKVDQLMQDLETRHLEIEAQNTTIQTLHDDLNKVEPEIEVKVQQIMERDRMIEEKLEQLQQQNKILVEIQITLDEKQKQIAELEAQLTDALDRDQRSRKELEFACSTIKMISEQLENLGKENAFLKKEVKKKNAKIRELVAELKESIELIKKTQWQAETGKGEDSVKEMVEEENERLWVELEQKKIEIAKMQEKMNEASRESSEKLKLITANYEECELKIKKLQKLLEEGGQNSGISLQATVSNGPNEVEFAALKEKLESRDIALQKQQALIENIKGELSKTCEDLQERKEEVKELKSTLLKKSSDVEDFIMNELMGRRQEVKDLQGRLFKGYSVGKPGAGTDNNMEILKMFMKARKLGLDPNERPEIEKIVVQPRSNSLSNLNEEANPKTDNKEGGNYHSGPKTGRSSSFSALDNVLLAQMGQKVYNTNQTFNTYVLPGEGGRDSRRESDVQKFASENSVVPSEALQQALQINDDTTDSHTRKLHSDLLSKSKGSVTQKESEENCQQQQIPVYSKLDSECLPVDPKTMKCIQDKMVQMQHEIQALKADRETLTETVSSLKKQVYSTPPMREGTCAQTENNVIDEHVHDGIVSDFKQQIEALKGEIKNSGKKNSARILGLASKKYTDSLQSYKEEIISLRKRLADSHDACNLLRNRLEELSDFLEQILEMEERGHFRLSHLSANRRKSLQKALDDSRSLSQSLSNSLMIGADSILEDSCPYKVSLHELPEEIDLARLDLSMAAKVLQDEQNGSFNASNATIIPQDFIYETLVSELDCKTEEMDNIYEKINALRNIVQNKDDKICEQTEIIDSLKTEIQFRENDNLLAKQSVISPCANFSAINMAHDAINESACSLHVSDLQYSNPSLSQLRELDFVKDVLVHPDNCSENSHSSATIQKAHSSLESSKSTIEYVRNVPNLVSDQSNIGSAYSTDFVVKNYNDLAKNYFDTKMQEDAAATLEQSNLAPALNLASPSESEAWSEPDRNVSLARIGLDASNLAVNHDRSLSRSRMTRTAPYTSESEGEQHPEEVRDGQATPCNKSKRRSDAVEVKRLASKLRNLEQMNETLKAELSIYQTLSQYLKNDNKPATSDKSIGTLEPAPVNNDSNSVTIPSSLFQEIRCLRRKLEEAITNNDLLRDQLEAALSGYLSEENKNLAGQLGAAQHQISLQMEAEHQLRFLLKENESRVSELDERLSHYLTLNRQMETKLKQYLDDMKVSKENLSLTEHKLEDQETILKCKGRTIESYEIKLKKLKEENCSFKSLQKGKGMDQNDYFRKVEELKINYEESLNKLKQETRNQKNEQAKKLEIDLEKSEEKRLFTCKENLTLTKQVKTLQAQLDSEHLKQNIQQEYSDTVDSESELNELIEKWENCQSVIKNYQKDIESLQLERRTFVKEKKILQEEVAALKSQLLQREKSNLIQLEKDGHSQLRDHLRKSEETNSLLQNSVRTLKEKNASYDRNIQKLESRQKELHSQLEAERCLTKNLQSQLQNANLLAKYSPKSKGGKILSSNVEVISSESRTTREIISTKEYSHNKPAGHSNSSVFWKENKENRLPPPSRNLSLPNFDDETMSGDSPDLGIGSDGQFSSLEKLNHVYVQEGSGRNKLCSDPSHGRLLHENEELRIDLRKTKKGLLQATEYLSKANIRKESVERAIHKQLEKTHNVLRQAGANLQRNIHKNRKESS